MYGSDNTNCSFFSVFLFILNQPINAPLFIIHVLIFFIKIKYVPFLSNVSTSTQPYEFARQREEEEEEIASITMW